VGVSGHSYRRRLGGRSLSTAPGHIAATVTCTVCSVADDVRLRSVMPPAQIDQKFTQLGWALDPNVCPACRSKPAKEKPMTKPSPAAIQAQVVMFTLLQTHFDADNGVYAAGWTDDKIAKQANLAVDTVAEFRRAGFGELKEPAELRQFREDVNALDQLCKETFATLQSDMASLRARGAELSRKYAA
jgi:hypothetical protein